MNAANLLKKPFPEFKEKVKSLSLQQILKLTAFSPEALERVRDSIPKPHEVVIEFDNTKVSVTLREKMSMVSCNLDSWKFSLNHNTIRQKNRMVKEIPKLLEDIRQILGLPMTRVIVRVDGFANFDRLSIWRRLKQADDVEFVGSSTIELELTAVLHFFKVTNHLVLSVQKCEEIEMSRLKPINCIRIDSAPWLGDRQFKMLDNVIVEIKKTKVSDMGVNQWIKKWMKGSESRTKIICIESTYTFNKRMLLWQIAAETNGTDKKRWLWISSIFLGYTEGCIKVNREDGAVASVSVEKNQVTIYVDYPE